MIHEPASVQFRNVIVRVGGGGQSIETVRDFNLVVEPGELVCLLGPSGCGKSTLLGAIAGFVPVASGTLLVGGKPITRPAADRGMVFQHHALFPWKTVLANVEFGLKMQGLAKSEREAQAKSFLERVGLTGFDGHYPSQLSGGMQQRVGLARVLVNRPGVVLLDEPFGALDSLTRTSMQELLLDVRRDVRTTMLFVTHDIDEAVYLADRVVVLSARPATVRAEIAIDFPRPRMLDLITTPAFAEIKRRCLDLLRD